MNHLTDEELVEQYYAAAAGAATADAAAAEAMAGRAAEAAAANAHLRECAQCAAALAALESDLAVLRPVRIPERDENYGEQMWARVEGALPPRALKRSPALRFALWRGLAYAASCGVLVAGGFFVGRVWEQRHAVTTAHVTAAPVMVAPQPKVVVVVLGDHLDRSERLLVELKHANGDTADLAPLPAEARSLLAANRVFRDDAMTDGDPGLTKALDHLDRLLTEIANRPGGLDAAEAARIRDEMNAEGLLFEVRVLRSKNPHRMNTVRVVAKGGAA
ncbi:hypothetical protein [Occallatibacter riparius]|uniref:Uncharacterized protein n=1 Tax=Occallatibacter riparius TaxID=1002689 RepID=A0A9J7BN08_9BACT|nr:hypothetical protein [Occallatibacter riparius]UWZ82565.1 hypothetical protein MOP44_18560 [Occallatibacter riparius]